MLISKQSAGKMSFGIMIISTAVLASSTAIFVIYKVKLQAAWSDLVVKLSLAIMAVSAVILSTVILYNSLSKEKVQLDSINGLYGDIIKVLAKERNMVKEAYEKQLTDSNEKIKSLEEQLASIKHEDTQTSNDERKEKDTKILAFEKQLSSLQQKLLDKEGTIQELQNKVPSNVAKPSYVSLEYQEEDVLRNKLQKIQEQIKSVVEELEEWEEKQHDDDRKEKITQLEEQLKKLEVEKGSLKERKDTEQIIAGLGWAGLGWEVKSKC